MERSTPLARLLAPVLDTYMDSAVGVIGCRSQGLARDSCEQDVLVVGPENLPPTSMRVGDGFVDLIFITEKEAMRPSSSETSLSLALAKTVRDNAMLLSSSASAALGSFDVNARRSGEERLTSAVKAIGRSEDSLSRAARKDADFWLLSASYEFAYAWLFSEGKVPAPSHLIAQLRQLPPQKTGMFEVFSKASGLEAASRSSCEVRLDSLGVLYDLLQLPSTESGEASTTSTKVSYELIRAKCKSMLRSAQPVDCYCFLGFEIARCIPKIPAARARGKARAEIVSSLSEGEDRLLADKVVQELGITRSEDSVEAGLKALRGQVSDLTRRA